MLINEPSVLRGESDPTLRMISALIGNGRGIKQLRDGVYERGDFGSSAFLRGEGYEQYPDFDQRGCYGVCDDVDQLINHYPELTQPGRQFVVMVTPIVRSEQPSEGGWRWHKWGEYIGTREPQCEYLHDEPTIDRVLCFHIYERSKVAA